MKSTTPFVRNSSGNVADAFGIDSDMTDYLNATRATEIFASISHQEFADQERMETFATTIQETVVSLFEQAMPNFGKQPVSPSTEEKVNWLAKWRSQGPFRSRELWTRLP